MKRVVTLAFVTCALLGWAILSQTKAIEGTREGCVLRFGHMSRTGVY